MRCIHRGGSLPPDLCMSGMCLGVAQERRNPKRGLQGQQELDDKERAQQELWAAANEDTAEDTAEDSKGGKRPRATGVETNAQDKARGVAFREAAVPTAARAGHSADEEGAALSSDEGPEAPKVERLSVLSPAVRKARDQAQEQRAQAPEQQAADEAADEAMLQAALNQVSELWPFTPLLEIAGGMVSSDGHLSLFGMEITVNLLLEQCVLKWARFKEEEALAPEALMEKLKADIDSFPTAVLLVRPVESGGAGSGCALSLCSLPCVCSA